MVLSIARYLNSLISGCLIVLLAASAASPASFSINPVRIYFDEEARTNTLSVKNESSEDITLQLTAFSWLQDEQGNDIYSPTGDIIVFPRIMKIGPSEEKLVRLGTTVPREQQEKTYRLYLEEVPLPGTGDATAVRIVMKVGVPLFVAPPTVENHAELTRAELSGGMLDLTLRNKGNVHLIIQSIRAAGYDEDGRSVFNTDMGGKYALSGTARDFRIPVPRTECLRLKRLDVHIDTDKLSLDKTIDVDQRMCAP